MSTKPDPTQNPHFEMIRAIQDPMIRTELTSVVSDLMDIDRSIRDSAVPKSALEKMQRFATYLRKSCRDIMTVNARAKWATIYGKAVFSELMMYARPYRDFPITGAHEARTTLIDKLDVLLHHIADYYEKHTDGSAAAHAELKLVTMRILDALEVAKIPYNSEFYVRLCAEIDDISAYMISSSELGVVECTEGLVAALRVLYANICRHR
jgi:hypothetical protein